VVESTFTHQPFQVTVRDVKVNCQTSDRWLIDLDLYLTSLLCSYIRMIASESTVCLPVCLSVSVFKYTHESDRANCYTRYTGWSAVRVCVCVCVCNKSCGLWILICVCSCGPEAGSAECKERWPCTVDDFYEYQSTCDSYNKVICFFLQFSVIWTPAQRKRASMLYFGNVLFIYLFFMAALFSGPG